MLLYGYVLGDEFSLKSAYRVGVGKDRLSIVLRLVAGPPGFPVTRNTPSPDVDQFTNPSLPTLVSVMNPLCQGNNLFRDVNSDDVETEIEKVKRITPVSAPQ